jgi:hypothetical protein
MILCPPSLRISTFHEVTLDYAGAQHHLQLALRRGPQNRHAEPFRSLVARHPMVVEMVQGQVPPRGQLLGLPVYLALARSILQGDVVAFREVARSQQFVDDGLAPLVQRLRSAVILAGLTAISRCYSRIRFGDVAGMLHIGSAEDAERFCAKAAADGLIDAVIDHEGNASCRSIVGMTRPEGSGRGFIRISRTVSESGRTPRGHSTRRSQSSKFNSLQSLIDNFAHGSAVQCSEMACNLMNRSSARGESRLMTRPRSEKTAEAGMTIALARADSRTAHIGSFRQRQTIG